MQQSLLYARLNIEDSTGTNIHTHLCNKLFLWFLPGSFLVTPMSVQASAPHMLEVSPSSVIRLRLPRLAVFTFTTAPCTVYFWNGNCSNASHLPSITSRCRTVKSFPFNWPEGVKASRGILNQVVPPRSLTSLLEPEAESAG